MGVGVLYGREELLNEMPPYQGGGEMIQDVTFEKTTYNELPFKFEAGTPSVGDVLGLGAAIDFMLETGIDNIARHEAELLDYATRRLSEYGAPLYPAHNGPLRYLRHCPGFLRLLHNQARYRRSCRRPQSDIAPLGN